MRHRVWIAPLLALAVVSAGCEAAEDRLRSLLYDESDTAVPTPQDDEQLRQQRTVEPGADPGDATVIELSDEIEPIYAELGDEADAHWFSLQTGDDEEWMVDLEVEPQDDSLDVAVYLDLPGSGEAPVRYDIAGAGEIEELPMLRVGAGGEPQRFSVTGADGQSGAYSVRVHRRLTAATVAAEPNDVPQLAMELEVPGEVQGFYQRPGDRDLFFVPAESLSAGVYSLEISAVPGLEQLLRIYGDDELDEVLAQVSVSEQAPAIIPNLSLDAEEGDQAGLYFVLTADGDGFDREQGYRLRLVEHPDADEEEFTVEREPNNTESTAQWVDFDERVRGYLHTADDVDRFRFEIEDADDEDDQEDEQEDEQEEERADVDDEEVDTRPEALQRMLAEQADFEDDGDDELEQLIREEGYDVVDPWEDVEQKESHEYVIQARLKPLGDAHRMAMEWIPDADSDDERQELIADDPEEPLVVCNRIVADGEHHVRIWSEETDEGFRPRGYDYEFEVVNVAYEMGLEIEPNDSPETADRLQRGEPRIGFIDRDGDEDYFAFVVGDEEPRLVDREEQDDDESGWGADEMESVTVSLEGNPLDLQFEILDDEGGRVAHVDEGGPGSDEQLQIDLPHGLYYVAVRAGIGSNCEPYRIEVTTP